MSCLTSCWDDLNSFTSLVGRLWPYGEFYTAAFDGRRLRLLSRLFVNMKVNPPSPAVFQHLCGSTSFTEEGRSTITKVLSRIIWALGNSVWYSPDIASKWYSAIRDTVLHLDKASLMPEQQLLEIQEIRTIELFPSPKPFTNMFLASMLALPGYMEDLQRARQHKIGSRLANCGRAIQMWLNVLQECGIDLKEYGRQERQRLRDQENGYEFRIYRDVWHESPCLSTQNGLFVVRLISFECGRQPGDWKLWWSEPTDGLVGDFWKGIEPEPFCIPGSWDEDS